MVKLVKTQSEAEYLSFLEGGEFSQKLVLFRQGSGVFKFKGEVCKIPGPAVINLSPLMEITPLKLDFSEAYILSFSKKSMDLLISQAFLVLCPMTGIFHMKLNRKEFSVLEGLLKLMLDPGLEEEILTLHALLLVKYLARFLTDSNSRRISENDLVKQYVQSVDRDHKKFHQINLYAQTLGVSTRTLNRIFKENTGITPKESLNYRLNLEAKKHLLEKKKSVKEISFHLGFSSPEYFHAFFRRINGQAPGEYSRDIRV